MEIKCPYSKHEQKGYSEWKWCTILDDYCHHMRRCPTQNKVVHSSGAVECTVRKQKGESK